MYPAGVINLLLSRWPVKKLSKNKLVTAERHLINDQLIPFAMHIQDGYAWICLQFFPQFRDEHVQAPANDDAFIFPHFFHQLITLYHFLLGVGKYMQQFGFFCCERNDGRISYQLLTLVCKFIFSRSN